PVSTSGARRATSRRYSNRCITRDLPIIDAVLYSSTLSTPIRRALALRGSRFMEDRTMSDDVIIQVQDKIATLTFNRPDKLNALSPDLLVDSIDALTEWSRDPKIGAIIVTGTGRAFCAGGDVSMMAQNQELSLEDDIDRLRQMQELSWLLYSMPK